MGHDHKPDYAEIARLEIELGLAPAPSPAVIPAPPSVLASYPVAPPHPPAPPPITEPVPNDALYVCHLCGNRVRAGATSCNHCGGTTWRRDDD